jgi:anti-anti-sigma factor
MDDMNQPASALVIDVEEGTPTTIRITGDVDMDTSASLAATVHDLLSRTTVGTIVFDLAGVTFMDSSGVAVLVNADNSEARVVVRDPSRAALLVIEATGLQHLLHSEP